MQGVGFETYTADGPISYWNNYVGVTQMGGHGSFSDPRIGLNITQTPDLVMPKLPALLEYQLSLRAPAPPSGSFTRAAARRGAVVFNGVVRRTSMMAVLRICRQSSITTTRCSTWDSAAGRRLTWWSF